MKKSLYTIIFFLIAGSIMAQNREFTIVGKLSDLFPEGSKVYLHGIKDFNRPNLDLLDSTTVSNGQFKLAGKMETPNIRLVRIENEKTGKKTSDFLLVEAGETRLFVDDAITTLTTSAMKDEHAEMKSKQIDFLAKINALRKKVGDPQAQLQIDEAEMKRLLDEMKVNTESFMGDATKYIKNNIGNGVGEFYFTLYAEMLPAEKLNKLYALARPQFKKYESIKLVVDSKNVLAEGSAYLDLELLTLDGSKALLSDHVKSGKVVLIDFWAAWCGPCRRTMPYFVSLYEKYKDKGFEIVGISLDEDQSSWESAVSAMRMNWVQLSDLKGWKSIAAEKYKVTRIPQSFLIDKKGIIVGLDLHGDELTNMIDRLLEE